MHGMLAVLVLPRSALLPVQQAVPELVSAMQFEAQDVQQQLQHVPWREAVGHVC
jgi:hypothetical protein